MVKSFAHNHMANVNLIANFYFLDTEHKRLWKLLEEDNLLTKEEFMRTVRRSKNESRSVTDLLLENDNLPEARLLELLAEFYKLPFVMLREKVIVTRVINLIPKEMADQHSVVIFKKVDKIIHVATTAPHNLQTIEFIKKKTGLEPKLFITTPRDIRHALKCYDTKICEDFEKIIKMSTSEALAQNTSAEKMAEFFPIIKMTESIMDRAIAVKASDIHIESNSDHVSVRFRIDGILRNIVKMPKEIMPALAVRKKSSPT